MNARRCCDRPTRISPARRGLDIAGHVVPTVVLVLLPKCPACIAAYLAMGAGIGVTITTAAYLRTLLLCLCLTCLAVLAARHVRRWIAIRSTS